MGRLLLLPLMGFLFSSHFTIVTTVGLVGKAEHILTLEKALMIGADRRSPS